MTLVTSAVPGTLAQRLMPRSGFLANHWLANALLIVGGSLFVALSAQIRIPLPFTPVPITGQTLGVLLVGSLLGSRQGLLSMLLYLLLGAVGLPFFAGGNSGVAVLYGATAGYLAAFPLTALLVGWLAERGWDRRVGTMVASMALGSVVIYTLGVSWLALHIGLTAAVANGLLPFVVGDIIKIALAGVALPGGWLLLGKR